jgi:hypothetical protein
MPGEGEAQERRVVAVEPLERDTRTRDSRAAAARPCSELALRQATVRSPAPPYSVRGGA